MESYQENYEFYTEIQHPRVCNFPTPQIFNPKDDYRLPFRKIYTHYINTQHLTTATTSITFAKSGLLLVPFHSKSHNPRLRGPQVQTYS